MKIQINSEIIKTDFLVVGGGIGGLQAAITAAKAGANVVVAEKADTRRSGNGANGNDHFLCYIPEEHGELERAVREVGISFEGGPWTDISMLRLMLARSFEVIKEWDSMGINMRPTGKWHFEGHSIPGQQLYHLKFDGKQQKGLLTKSAKENGARIMNHIAINDLLINDEGRVVGAIGVDITEDEPRLVVFQAKAVLLAAGMAARLYPAANPAYLFNLGACPADCGSGHAIALRAGARLVNIDMPQCHAGTRYFVRGGKGTWIGISSDINGVPVTPYIGKPSRELGAVTSDVWPGVYKDKLLDGSGPVYMNCTELSEEDHAYMREAFKSEGIESVYDYLDQHGIDLRKSMIEFGTFNYDLNSRGIEINEKAEGSLPGLYAAGDLTGNVRGSLTGAAIFGKIAGEAAAEYVKTIPEYDISEHPLISSRVALYNSILEREKGADWKEANSMIQQLMNDYIGTMKVRSANLFKAGIKYIRDLRRFALNELKSENSHELMRCMEVLDLIDVGEAVAVTGDFRKESRELHRRTDYPYTNLTLNNKFMTVVKDHNGEFNMAYRNRH